MKFIALQISIYLNSDFPFSKTNSFILIFLDALSFFVWTQNEINNPNLLIPIFSDLVALLKLIPISVFRIAKLHFSAADLSPLNFSLIWLLMYSLIILGFTSNCSCLKFTAKLEFVKRFKVSIEVRYPFVLLIFSASFEFFLVP